MSSDCGEEVTDEPCNAYSDEAGGADGQPYTRDSDGTGSHRELYNKRSHKSFMKNHLDLKHEGEPEKFKCVVLEKFQDPLTRQVAESLNIANGMNATELCNSRAEYHQPQIVRVSREVQRGL